TSLATLTRVAGEVVSGSPYAITAASFNALTGTAAGNYSAPSFIGSPTLTVTPASLTGSIANQTKVYGANDPTLSGIGVTLNGLINRSVSTWNGSVVVNDSSNVATTLASLTRNAGEVVSGSPYSITSATFNTLSGSAASNYNAPSFIGSPTLTVTPASLTGSIANQTKVYGANDPTLSGIGVTLNGLINRTVTTWNGSVALNDTSSVATSLATLTRVAGEVVSGSPYAITAASFNALTGTAAGNYSAPTFTGSPTLAVTPASLTGSIANQTKVYGANDPTLSGIGVTLNGLINRTVTTWNGSVALNDTSSVATSLATLTRVAGEVVSGSPYAITAASFNALTGTAASNYNAPSFIGSPTLTVTPASLTGSIANQTKVYGANDPTLSGIGVTLNGLINRTVTTWNGSVVLDDSSNVATSLATLTRVAGEVVSGSPYAITAASFNALTGSAASNYNAPSFIGSPTLTVTPASLTGSIANQTKVYGANDPTLSGIGVTLTGLINRTVTTWNGSVVLDDSSNVATSLATLTRVVGEVVSGSPYAITAASFNALTGSAAGNYSAPTFTGSPTLTVTPASLTGSIANQSKVYGANDPTLSGIGVTLNGLINRTVTTWNGAVALNDSSSVATSLASLTRVAGEVVSGSPYSITSATFNTLSGSAAGNYSAPTLTGSPTLTVSSATLTGSLANQNKVYGSNDPTLSSIVPTLNGLINRNVSTWNGSVAIDDTNSVATTLASLTRVAGEMVNGSPYAITAASFNALTGSSAGNYSAPILVGSPNLIITPANLTGSIANQNKIYGTNDPSLAGIGVILNGLINSTVSTWNGNVAIDDTNSVVTSLLSLTRIAGEGVSTSPYTITSATFNALTGVAADNYMLTNLIGSPVLAINPASLTVNAIAASKVYGSNDPTFTYTQSGLVNHNVEDWMGNIVSINDNLNGSLSRMPGENVGNYLITIGTLSAGANYFMNYVSANLGITPATLTYSADPVSRTYGSSNPSFTGNVLGFVNSDTLSSATTGTLSFASPALNTSNVGNYLIEGFGLTAVNGNYNFVQATGNATALTVTPATLNTSGILANNKDYNGQTATSLNFNHATLTGVLFNDAVSIDQQGYSANFISAEVGTNIPVTVTNLGLQGSSASNYTLSQPTGLSANILNKVTPVVPDVIPPIPNLPGEQLVARVVAPYDASALTPIKVNATSTNIINNTSTAIENGIENLTTQSNVSNTAMHNTSLGDGISNTSGNTFNNNNLTSFNSSAGLPSIQATVQSISKLGMPSLLGTAMILFAAMMGLLLLRKELLLPQLNPSASAASSTPFNVPEVSFKVRAALQNIIGFSEMLYYGDLGHVSTLQQELLSNVLNESKAMLSNLSQHEAGTMNESLKELSFKHRTILNNIIGFTDLIHSGYVDPVTSVQKSFLSDILTGSHEVLQLIPGE
ncbi:MAG: hypothetical protein H0W64_09805, partial [Gammaproteobacteria bacterium]|nr:hypothetical protein [Gammaproteobacteria bacterium]